ncbi:MAG TPA: ABC transporter permease subunit, partial [Candidatus Limnocylindria bacterium]|nr:ABC transporter permease subunit [Candidatus Limnocylindria bacterium]
MTASISTPRPASALEPANFGRLSGFGALARRELMEWRRARRAWIVLIVSGLFLTLAALNNWLISVLPGDVTEGAEPPVLDPLMNLLSPVSTHVFVIVAVFAVIALITAERESGTLAWVASKPVSRSAIWLAKLTTASTVMFVVAAAVPLAATVALVVVLYGAVPVWTVVALAVGMAMIIVLYVAISLAA